MRLYSFGNQVTCCEVGNVYQDDSDTWNKGKMLPLSEHETSFQLQIKIFDSNTNFYWF